ncbi:MAG: GNAT family N-acetyltransferase, partial [Longimicrobiales bacterium]|nr:GNAT family N-acetyltransferase [Longimicrobiales bacterium]
TVFRHYPFPIQDAAHLARERAHGTRFFAAWTEGGQLAAAAAMEPGGARDVVEMTDFATLPEHRGARLAGRLLAAMEQAGAAVGVRLAYTIARARSFGMNITFGRGGYRFAGTLVNNTRIADGIESMNVWYRSLSGCRADPPQE